MLKELLISLLWAIGWVSFIAINVMFLVYLERKVAAHIQQRLGPMVVGYHGLLQPVADTLKLLTKQPVIPKGADRLLFLLAPGIVFSFVFLSYVIINPTKGFLAKDLELGILFFVAVSGVGTLGIIIAGYSSNNKYSLLGGLRSACQIISYEVALILPIVGVIIDAQTLSTEQIVKLQEDCWYILTQPLGFLIFLIAAVAETNRLPFDIPEAESELVGGFHTEYSGIRFSIFFLAEYASMFAISSLACILFLGGWQGLFGKGSILGIIWFLIKVYAILLFIIWIRWTYPRLRVDQLMSLCWKFLIPLGFLNLFLVALI